MATVRGATCSKNTKADICADTKALIQKMLVENKINIEDITLCLFSCTKDLNAEYPAKAARELGITEAALMCFQEMEVKGALEKCIRIMIQCNTEIKQSGIRHIYLKEAARLRPDISSGFTEEGK